MSTPQGATELGSSMYLWKSTTNSVDCIISAHGGFMSENRTFQVPSGVRLLFYGEHGAALLDPGIGDFFRNQSRAEPIEILTAGQACRNYLLSKYQGKHAGESGTDEVESYSSVKGAVNLRDMVRQKNFNTMVDKFPTDVQAAQRAFEQIGKSAGGTALTIRNRWSVVLGITLSEALTKAKKEMPTLRDFHCLFCRSSMLPDKYAAKLGQTMKASQGVKFG